MRPAEGRITGTYSIAEDGKVCVTWKNAEDEVENCDKIVKGKDEKYSWGGKTFEILPGDPKGLAN